MSQLSDLEEKILQVKNKQLVPNLNEAIKCYYASSYRACIILTFNSLVDDLVEKLYHLKDINSDAKVVYNNIKKLIDSQQAFENPLVEQLVKYQIFDELDGEIYKMFQKLRHKSAHPSGFNPSPECARFVFTEIVNRFLSKASLKTSERIDKLLLDIPEKNFFTGTIIAESVRVVKAEISDIHPQAYPQLISKLYDKYMEDNSFCYITFLCALSLLENPQIEGLLLSKLVKGHAHRNNNEILMVSLMSTNPAMFNEIDEVQAKRLIVKIKSRMSQVTTTLEKTKLSNPFYAILRICNNASGHLSSEMPNLMHYFIKNQDRLCYFLYKISKNNGRGAEAYSKLFLLILDELNSEDIERVSVIIRTITKDESNGFAMISDLKSFEIIKAIAQQQIKCPEIEELYNKGFIPLGAVFIKARKYFWDIKNLKAMSTLDQSLRDKLKIIMPEPETVSEEDMENDAL